VAEALWERLNVRKAPKRAPATADELVPRLGFRRNTSASHAGLRFDDLLVLVDGSARVPSFNDYLSSASNFFAS
jgi:hypothetical protein